jgi:hypothetical protein
LPLTGHHSSVKEIIGMARDVIQTRIAQCAGRIACEKSLKSLKPLKSLKSFKSLKQAVRG